MKTSLGLDRFWKAAIAGWSSVVLASTEVAVRRRDFYENEFLVHLRDRYDLNMFLGDGDGRGVLQEIPVDNAFRNLIRKRRFFDRVLLGRERWTLERLEDLLDQVREALS